MSYIYNHLRKQKNQNLFFSKTEIEYFSKRYLLFTVFYQNLLKKIKIYVDYMSFLLNILYLLLYYFHHFYLYLLAFLSTF